MTEQQKTEIPKKSPNHLLWILIVIAFLFVGIVFYNYFHHFNDSPFHNQEYAGQFGDYIGGTLNPILTFFSLIALLWTIGIQSRDLELTREELRRSAKAQEATKEVLNRQSETLARQQFESTFFSLLDQHNKALEPLTTINPGDTRNRIGRILRLSLHKATDLESAKETLESHNYACGHYFRILYHLLKFIATNTPGSTVGPAFATDKIQNEPPSDDEKMYSNIVRSFLGYEITQLLSINCYCKDDNDTYWNHRLLIERYAFFEHMPFEVNNIEHPVLMETNNAYEKKAFGNSEFITR